MLKLLTTAHAESLFCAVNPARSELVRWFEWPDRVTSPQTAAEYIDEIQKCSRIRLWWLIHDNGLPVGGVQMRMREGGECVSLPYWLVPRAQGRGLATTAVRQVLGIAKTIGFWKAKFDIALDNYPSARLALRLGFVPVGPEHDQPFRGGVLRTQAYELLME